MPRNHKKVFIPASIIFVVLIVLGTIIMLGTIIAPQKSSSSSTASQTADKSAPATSSDPLAAQKAAYFESEGDTLAAKGNISDAKSLYGQAKALYQSLQKPDAVTKVEAKIAKLDQQAAKPEPAPSAPLTTGQIRS